MKPLAAPVLGGMLSSLIHVLIVTPVIFFWIHERRLGLRHQRGAPSGIRWSPRWLLRIALVALVLLGSFVTWRLLRPSQSELASSAEDVVVQSIKSGEVTVTLRSPTGTLHTGRNAFTIEFRSASGALVDVGTVHATANMPMPGMVMPGNLEVQPSKKPGRYDATADFGMAGSYQMSLEWNGPAGRGSISFQGAVQ